MRILDRRQLFLAAFFLAALRLQSLSLFQSLPVSALSLNNLKSEMKVIDSHLHVWANPSEAVKYPYFPSQEPPPNLENKGSTDALLETMEKANVQGSLIVQPINHKFDHSYVAAAIKAHPNKFKGMMLHDPSMEKDAAFSKLEELKALGFVGVRFNPYLWPEGGNMSDGVGADVFKRCGELNMPVGIMCFKGLHLHLKDIENLISQSPETVVILDHFGFTKVGDQQGDKNFQDLLSLKKYPNVLIKISALFRVASETGEFPYDEVKTERFLPLLETFGSERLMVGTDFPFVVETKNGYKGAVDVVCGWLEKEEDKVMLMGGTLERYFGSWGC